MVSLSHEALVMLFRNRPALAPELVRDALHQPVPDFEQVEVKEADLSQMTTSEYRADLVVVLQPDAPVLGIVVEVQLGRDDDKRYAWPLYAAALRARLRCAVCLLVVAPDAAVARWARRPIETGQPGSPFVPLVLGPESVPRVADPEVARRAPELAVLSVQAHGRDEGALELALAALEAADELEDERGMLYCDLIWLWVGEAARRKLEDPMERGTYTYQSDFAKKYIAEGEEKGRQEGEKKGREEGEKKGRILAALELRFGEVPRELEGAVRELDDLDVLSELQGLAIRAPSLEAFEAELRTRVGG